MSEIQSTFIEHDMICNKCGIGRMRPCITLLKEYPPKYIHKCDKCSEYETFEVRYPYRENVEK